MKKAFKIFVLLLCALLLMSCDQDDPSNEPDAPYYDPYTPSIEKVNELRSFFRSHSYDIIYKTRSDDELFKHFELSVRKDRIMFHKFDKSSTHYYPLIFDCENNKLYYDFGEKAAISDSTYTNNINTALNIDEYIWNIKEVDGNLVFSIKMDSFINDYNIEISDFISYQYYEIITAVFRNEKIVELNYEVSSKFGSFTSIIQIDGYMYEDNDKSEISSLKKIEFPNIDDCYFVSQYEILKFLDGGPSGIIDNCELVIEHHDFIIINGHIYVTIANGRIIDGLTNATVDYVYLNHIKYSEEEVLSSEDGKFTVNVEFSGRVLTAEIQAEIISKEDVDRFEFEVSFHDFILLRDEVLVTRLSGRIKDTKTYYNMKDIHLDDVKYDVDEIRASKDGKFTISTEAFGLVFTTEIQAKVITDEILDTYEMIITNHDFKVSNGEVFVNHLSGYISDTINNERVSSFYLEDLMYDEEEILNSEDHIFTISTEYYDRVYTTQIQAISILNVDVEKKSINYDLSKISYVFSIGDYYYLCDQRYLYKFDEKFEVLFGKIDLHSIGNWHYVKDEYLYITSHLPYSDTSNPTDSYEGYITQINLDSFTVKTQVHVNCLPISIIVDNRNNVFISKGANQFVTNDVVNMENGSLLPLFNGYQGDKLIYDSINDTIITVTCGHTGYNELYRFDGYKWIKEEDCLIKGDYLFYVQDDLLVFNDGVYRYDSLTNEYIYQPIDITTLGGIKIRVPTNYVLVDDEYSYIFEQGSKGYSSYLHVYSLVNGKYLRYRLSSTYQIEIKYMYKISEDIYCISADGVIYKILI